jgi:hypothetical protein
MHEIHAQNRDTQPLTPTGLVLSTIRADINPDGRDGDDHRLHIHELIVTLKNESNARISDWRCTVLVPSPLLFPTPTTETHRAFVRMEGDRAMFEFGCGHHGSSPRGRGPIESRDSAELRLQYRMDHETYYRYQGELDHWVVTAHAYVDGSLVATSELKGVGQPPDTLQNY